MVANKGWIQYFWAHEVLYSMKRETWIQRHPEKILMLHITHSTAKNNRTDEFMLQQGPIV